jgi:SagB-type dehydrogenase family enzyme
VDTDRQPSPLSEEYHVGSRNAAGLKHLFPGHQIHYNPAVYLLTKEAPLHLEGYPRVPLPPPVAVGMPLDQAITRRSSGREYAPTPLAAEALATLLYLSNAVRRDAGAAGAMLYRRNVPSSGNLGSIEVYPIVLDVRAIDPGIYHFDTIGHDLACLRAGRFARWLSERVLFQSEFEAASAALVLTSSVGRLRAKYGQRGYRLGLLDAGHVSQNLYLAATGLGLNACATAGFIDDELDAALGLDGVDTASMLVILVGQRPEALPERTLL